MCKKSSDPEAQITTSEWSPTGGHCPALYHRYGDKCFLVGSELLTWHEALERCSKLHPHNMISIASEKEQGCRSVPGHFVIAETSKGN